MAVKLQFRHNLRAARLLQIGELWRQILENHKTAILAATKIILSRYVKLQSSVMNRRNRAKSINN
jgi:hypothetical protein